MEHLVKRTFKVGGKKGIALYHFMVEFASGSVAVAAISTKLATLLPGRGQRPLTRAVFN